PAPPPASPPPRRVRRGAGVLAVLLVLLGALVTVPAVALVGARAALHDPQAWVDRLGPMHTKLDVAEPLADEFITALEQDPTAAITAQERRALIQATSELIRSPEFARDWEAVLRDVQAQTVALASDSGPPTVVLHLAPLVALVKLKAAARGYDLRRLQPADGDVVIVSAGRHGEAQRLVRAVDRSPLVVALLAVVLIALGLVVARNRWRALTVAGLAITVLALASAGLAATVPRAVATGLAHGSFRPAAGHVVDAVTHPFLVQMLIVALIGLVIGVAGLVLDLSRRAR
ncbi:MAG: hypothetical protein JWM05_3438, partial [Acidimicrobiales bacterium]|nr:hypothetical protein [Acidimicrobiales bacterium]